MTTTVTVNEPSDEDRRTRCRVLIGIMLVHADPELRRVDVLAGSLGITRQHLNDQIRLGRCTPNTAKKMAKKFGKALAPFDELCWTRANH